MMGTIFVDYIISAGLFVTLCFGQPSNRYENVALNKDCMMSSEYNGMGLRKACKMAVNGDTERDYPYNGIHTSTSDTNPRWTVYLGRTYPIFSITVWPRPFYWSRMSNVVVLVASVSCFEFDSQYSSSNVSIEVCAGRYLNDSMVTVYRRKVGGEDFININEIQVWSCKAAYWGKECQHDCGNCTTGQVCDKLTGSCDSCNPGWKTPLCSQECDYGTFGQNCSNRCSSNCEVCHKVNGNCECKPGWKPPLCTEACTPGTWGKDCLNQCGSGCKTSPCDFATGKCACELGWQQPYCYQECRSGTYGQDCAKSCGQGCIIRQGISACDTRNGSCTCQSGWVPPLCEQQESAGSSRANVGVIVGSIAAVVLVLVLVILVVVLIMRQVLSGNQYKNQ